MIFSLMFGIISLFSQLIMSTIDRSVAWHTFLKNFRSKQVPEAVHTKFSRKRLMRQASKAYGELTDEQKDEIVIQNGPVELKKKAPAATKKQVKETKVEDPAITDASDSEEEAKPKKANRARR